MIGRLTGRVIEEDDGTTLVDVNGVGYELITPLGTIGRAKTTDDGCVMLFVHTHVREDQLSLFGFASEGDRLAFRTLIGVSSVGPKTAISVLSALPAHELGQAIARKELGKLTAISGIGKKTAERLLLELKGKMAPVLATPDWSAVSDAQTDILQALIALGYSDKEAQLALKALPTDVSVSDGIKQALKALAR